MPGYAPLAPIPFAGRRDSRVTDILMRQGEQQAQSALNSGENWGRAIQGIGSAVAGGIEAHQQGLAMKAKAQFEQQKAEREAAKEALNERKINHDMQLADEENIRKADESMATLAAKRAELATAHADTLGDIGAGLQGHLNDPDGGVGAAMFAIDKYKDALGEDAPKYAEMIQSDPSQLRTLVERSISNSPRQRQLAAERAEKEAKAKGEAAKMALDERQFGETVRHNKAAEANSRATAGGADTKKWIVRGDKAVFIPESQIQAGDLPYESAQTGKKRIPAGSAEELGAFDSGLDEVASIRGAVKGKTGAVAKAGTYVPDVMTEAFGWGQDAKSTQATIERVKQIIGKTLEGGVLRKEDETKYAKIIPTISDNDKVIASKLDGLDDAIKRKKGRQVDALEDAGYDMALFRERAAKAGPAASGGVDLAALAKQYDF